jgi:hypothetical protein
LALMIKQMRASQSGPDSFGMADTRRPVVLAVSGGKEPRRALAQQRRQRGRS